jgi:pyridoxal phosphate enzyme (YggS family)
VLRDRLEQVEERIHQACNRVGRKRQEITLVAVTKAFPAAVALQAWELGLREFGENYVQEFEAKHAELGELAGARFHLIGHLQSNKARKAAELFQVVQTVDSEKLVRRLASSGKPLELMIEVKLSQEESKSGADAGIIPAIIAAARESRDLQLTGLMTIPPWSENPEETRPHFRRLAELARANGLAKLSMGMSHDFEAAIEEGATHIRVGTALFGSRTAP